MLLSVCSILLIVAYSVTGYDTRLHEGSTCQLEDGTAGVCTKITDCEDKLQQVLGGRKFTESDGLCGFDTFIQVVCCKNASSEQKHRVVRRTRPAERACVGYLSAKLRSPSFGIRINAGREVEDDEFTYVVALGITRQKSYEPPVQYVCGGSLVAPQYVLTAGHCVKTPGGRVVSQARIGSKKLDEESQNVQHIPIEKMFTHPEFSPTTSYHDIAVVKLKYAVSSSDFVPACLRGERSNTLSFRTVIGVGWGRTEHSRSSNILLKTPDLSIVNRAQCGRMLMSNMEGHSVKTFIPRGITDSMICAADSNVRRGGDTCAGDSGGPLVLSSDTNAIIGVISFGAPCGTHRGTPGVYTAVLPYLEWIESIIWP